MSRNNFYLPFKDFGGLYPDIFQELVSGKGSITEFIKFDPTDFTFFVDHFRGRPPVKLPQQVVQDILQYNTLLRAGRQTIQNIPKLLTGAHVIVTGQQPNVYGGPMYILFKVHTCLLLRDLIETITKTPTVCIFWNHSDDDKIANFDDIVVLDKNKRPVRIELDKTDEIPAYLYNNISALTRFSSKVWDVIAPPEEFKESIKESMKANLASFFSKLLLNIFDNEGLILVEPRIFSYEFMNHFYSFVLDNTDSIIKAFNDGVSSLEEAGFKTGLGKTNSPGMFLIDGKKKKKINNLDGTLVCDGEKLSSDVADLNTHFRRLTASFFLRPLLQDALLKTSVYVSGPNELTYQA
ncbi:MAG: bacillithiol biosynthesis BshC, partial [Planctomycetes bacterium]|nr:bacillithiol biosynthesis BshC [Planctomycetota bacterium]